MDDALGIGPDPDDDTTDGPYFRPYRMGGLMRRGVTEPTRLEGLLYPGRLHSLAGPPESGKTVLSLWLAWLVMQRGRPVLYVDEEAGPDSIASILLGFGADPALIEEKLIYLPFPTADWGHEDLTGLKELMDAHRPALSIWDSLGALLAVADQDENAARDVTRFWSRVLMPVARNYHCAILATDHDAKTTTETRYARGSGAKLANVDVMLKLSPLRPFSRMQDGLLALEITKDRFGWLHRHWHVKVTHAPLACRLLKAAPPTLSGMGLPPGAEALANALTNSPSSVRDLVDRIVAGGGIPMKRQTVSSYLNMLLDRGMCDRLDQGPGREALWALPTQPDDEP